MVSLAACSSPNRGRWSGTFDGNVNGVVEFEINTRGTRLRGSMDGQTSTGEPFEAKIEGILRQDYIDAEFEGAATAGRGLPLRFEGRMTGSLAAARGEGDWQATIKVTGSPMAGTWQVEQSASKSDP